MTFEGIFQKTKQLTREEENDLVYRFKNGDREALEKLFKLHARTIMHYCRARCRSEPEADDLFSFLYEPIVEALEKYDPASGWRLSTFIGVVIKRRANRHFKDLNKTDVVSFPMESIIVFCDEGDAEEQAMFQEFMSHVNAFINKLPKTTQIILELRKDGMSHKQIARELRDKGMGSFRIQTVNDILDSLQRDMILHLREIGMCDRKYIGDKANSVVKALFE